jgi:hypothetical protein
LDIFLEVRPKLHWATNIESKVKSNSPKKRILEYESTEEQIENTPLSKRQSPLITHHDRIISTQPSVIDDEELDFL